METYVTTRAVWSPTIYRQVLCPAQNESCGHNFDGPAKDISCSTDGVRYSLPLHTALRYLAPSKYRESSLFHSILHCLINWHDENRCVGNDNAMHLHQKVKKFYRPKPLVVQLFPMQCPSTAVWSWKQTSSSKLWNSSRNMIVLLKLGPHRAPSSWSIFVEGET